MIAALWILGAGILAAVIAAIYIATEPRGDCSVAFLRPADYMRRTWTEDEP